MSEEEIRAANAANAVALRLPPFWPKRPDVWFAQAEAEFELKKITADSTKYCHVISALDQDTAVRISDLLRAPPDTNKFQALRARLTDTFELTETEKSDRLLELGELGDRSPLELMDELRGLCGDHGVCFIAKSVFLRALPPAVRLQMHGVDFSDVQAAAKKAHNLWVIHRQQNAQQFQISRLDSKPPHNKTGRSKSSQEDRPDWCYYHNRFKDAAKKCKSPCTYSPQSGNSSADRI